MMSAMAGFEVQVDGFKRMLIYRFGLMISWPMGSSRQSIVFVAFVQMLISVPCKPGCLFRLQIHVLNLGLLLFLLWSLSSSFSPGGWTTLYSAIAMFFHRQSLSEMGFSISSILILGSEHGRMGPGWVIDGWKVIPVLPVIPKGCQLQHRRQEGFPWGS